MDEGVRGGGSGDVDCAPASKRALAARVFEIFMAIGLTCCAASTEAAGAEAEQAERWQMQAGIAPAREHANNIRLLTGYLADAGECGDVLLGPLPEASYTGEEAWLKLIEPVCPVVRQPNRRTGRTEARADLSRCKCSYGLPALARLPPGHMLVTASTLPTLDEHIPNATLLMDRKRIQDTGAKSVADLLRYLPQTAFHRGAGYRASGVQYAELRGIGAAYTLVLLNGRRTYGTASDTSTHAFDLSAIPISAVERVEISFNANSVLHGMDAIGGIVNIILKDGIQSVADLRYSAVRGGGAQREASISGGVGGDRARLAVFFDLQHQDELLGRERDRWSNQDFTRYGGQDYRSELAWPPNIRSIDGESLPGLDAPFAAAEMGAGAGSVHFIAGQKNRTSLHAYHAIVPRANRHTMLAQGSARLGQSVASMELLLMRRANELQTFPSTVSDEILGAGHPDNLLGVPVRVDALLVGLPVRRHHTQTTLRRGVAALKGQLGSWRYDGFLVHSDEQALAWVDNVANEDAIARGLQSENLHDALRLYSTVRGAQIPEGILIDAAVDTHEAEATQAQWHMRGTAMRLPAGDVALDAGVEHRQERVDFDSLAVGAGREITSLFTQLQIPLLSSATGAPVADELRLVLGARADNYSDIGTITRKQFGLSWRMTDSITWRASSSESFRPPSLAELHLPQLVVPSIMFDPQRRETYPVYLRVGGNPHLRPTSGRADCVGVEIELSESWRLSTEYWRIASYGHITELAPISLLANEAVVTEQVVRAPPTQEEQAAGQPGRLLLLDVSRRNARGATAQGVDLSFQASAETRFGMIASALSVSLTDKFRYSDVPGLQGRTEDRVGVASEYGTIPARRAVFSVVYEHSDWSAALHARVTSSYRDRGALDGKPIQRRVPGGVLWDGNLSRVIGANFRLTFGVMNITDQEPAFVHAGGSLGFDPSQGDLQGREFYGRVTVTFD